MNRRAYRSLLRRGGVPLSAVADIAGVSRSSLYNWLYKYPPKRASDRMMLSTIETAIRKCLEDGTLPVEEGAPPTEIRQRITEAIPEHLRHAMR